MDSRSDEWRVLQNEMQSAIQQVLQKHGDNGEAVFLSKFILIAAVVEVSGENALWSITADGMTAWDILGLIEYARYMGYKSDND